ncbi:MAG: hypothetical protein ACK5LC_01985 [Coprobacillaceae bacterium]
MEFTTNELNFITEIIKSPILPFIKGRNILSTKEAEEVIKGLEKKDILNNDTLSDRGCRVCFTIEAIAKSKEYLKWNSLRIYKCGESYVTLREKKEDTLDIQQFTKDAMILGLLHSLVDGKEVGEKKYRVRHIKKEDYIETTHGKTEIEGIFYEKVEENKKEVGVLYVEDGYMKQYIPEAEKLHNYPKSKVYTMIEKLLIGGV